MKYRLVELLECPQCRSPLTLSVKESRPVAVSSAKPFHCQLVCGRTGAAISTQAVACEACTSIEVVSGSLACRGCRDIFPIVGGVPWITGDLSLRREAAGTDLVAVYSHLWRNVTCKTDPGPNHLALMESTLGGGIIRGSMGLDVGSGCGADTVAMACQYPTVELISLDLSEGVYETYRRTEGLSNVHVVRGSVLSIPLRSQVCDFGYSFGVLHHTPDPLRGLKEIVRVLKPGGCVSLYLYEDHADNPWKAIPLKAVAALRRLTVRLNSRVLSALCYVLSPFVVFAFSIPAKIMCRFKVTRAIGEQMPFNFGTSPFSVHGDLMDRFGAPIEERYSREGVMGLLEGGELTAIRASKLKTLAGWVARGVKLDS